MAETIAAQRGEAATHTVLYREALNEALREEMRRDPTVFLMGEGIAERGGSYKVTEGLLSEFGPSRVIDTPISEASFVGAGVGAAIVGMRPVVEILFVDFALLAMDQICNQAAKFGFMSGGQGRVPLVIRTQGGTGNGLAAQHSQSLEAIFYHIPGLKVVTPSTPYDAKGLLVAAIRLDDPVIFIEHKMLYTVSGSIPNDPYVIDLGQGDIKRKGTDATLIAWSAAVPKCLAAADRLAEDGVEVEVIDPRTLVPLDLEMILSSVRRTGHVAIVQEAAKRGGVASDLASTIQAEAFDYLDAPIEVLAGRNSPIPFNSQLEKVSVPQVQDVVRVVKRCVNA